MATNRLERLAGLLVNRKFMREFEGVCKFVANETNPFNRSSVAKHQLERLFREEILATLYPLPLTLSELCEEFEGETSFRHKDGLDVEAYVRSLEFRLEEWSEGGRVRFRKSAPFPIAVTNRSLDFDIATDALFRESDDEDSDVITLWGTGPSSAEVLAGPHDRDKGASKVIYADFGGEYSIEALEERCDELAPIIRSMFASALLSNKGRVARLGQLPIIDLGDKLARKTLRRYLDFVSDSLAVYLAFNPFARKTLAGLSGRLPIAMIMLSEADRQARAALALALCFSSIESLFGGEAQDITKTLAENVAALLEPDRRSRPDAVRLVKKLYSVRSKFIHGARLEHEPDAVADCRLLSAAVVRALLERWSLDRRAGTEGSDYLAELKRDFATGQFIVGPDRRSAAQRLWRADTGTSKERGSR